MLLGEDEAAAKNRLVLICSDCRLVNGQAPPGVKTLEEVGRWRCSSCGAWNGIETIATKAVREMAERSKIDADSGEEWEKVPKSPTSDNEEPPIVLQDSKSATTGRDTEDSTSVNKRITRSKAADEPLESLE